MNETSLIYLHLKVKGSRLLSCDQDVVTESISAYLRDKYDPRLIIDNASIRQFTAKVDPVSLLLYRPPTYNISLEVELVKVVTGIMPRRDVRISQPVTLQVGVLELEGRVVIGTFDELERTLGYDYTPFAEPGRFSFVSCPTPISIVPAPHVPTTSMTRVLSTTRAEHRLTPSAPPETRKPSKADVPKDISHT